MTATNQTNIGITLEVNMFQFINEYIADGYPGLDVDFDYGHFRDLVHNSCSHSIEIKNRHINTLIGYDWKQDFFTEYGLLRYAYETPTSELLITETDNDRTGNHQYWKYEIRFSDNGDLIIIQFYTRWRMTAFKEWEVENITVTTAKEMLEITQQKPVLCLESISDHFKHACRVIHEAYENGYYDSIDDVEYPNYVECISDWMGYSNRAYAGCECMPVVCQAVDSAFNWIKFGLKSGVLNWLDND